MSIRASRSPSRAPAFLLRPPGPPRSNGSPAGATAPPGSFPYSRPRARREAARSERCPHISRAGGRPAQTFPPSCSFPVSSRLVSNTRGGRATLSAGLLPSPPRASLALSTCPFLLSVRPFPVPVLFFPLPVRPPTRACAVIRTLLRPRCACAAFPAATTLHSASPARGGPGRAGKTPPFCPEGRGPSSAPALPLPGLPTKNGRAPGSAPGPGMSGRGPRVPFVPAIPGLLIREFLKHELAHPGRGVPGPRARGTTHVGRHDRTPSFRAV